MIPVMVRIPRAGKERREGSGVEVVSSLINSLLFGEWLFNSLIYQNQPEIISCYFTIISAMRKDLPGRAGGG
jgi:hypothetical protein